MQQNNKEERQNCPICLSKPRNPSKPDTCSHLFCRNCLQEWAKIQNTCPVCKQKFKKVISLSPRTSKKKSELLQTQSRRQKHQEKYVSNHNQEEKEEQRMFGVLCGPHTRHNEMAFLNLLCTLESAVEE